MAYRSMPFGRLSRRDRGDAEYTLRNPVEKPKGCFQRNVGRRAKAVGQEIQIRFCFKCIRECIPSVAELEQIAFFLPVYQVYVIKICPYFDDVTGGKNFLGMENIPKFLKIHSVFL